MKISKAYFLTLNEEDYNKLKDFVYDHDDERGEIIKIINKCTEGDLVEEEQG